MNGLLGKITSITPELGEDGVLLKVGVKAVCLLPQRKPAPAWLRDQVLTITRCVPDAREVGHLGDSIILSPLEAAPWLYPFEVVPAVSQGEVPAILQLHWHWWKGEPSPATVRANGRTLTFSWQPDGVGWTTIVETVAFFDVAPRLPITFEITCEGLKVESAVQPGATPFAASLLLRERAIERLDNNWYQLDITARSHGGAILSLREKGREADHFRAPDGMIAPPLENGGHADGFKTGWGAWSSKMQGVAMDRRGARREDGATRLTLEGVVDEGEGLRTSLACTLHDEWPLLLWQREWSFGPKKDDKQDEVREAIDDLRPMQPGFRAAAMPERGGASGSRVLCSDGERLVVMRPVQSHEHRNHWNWTMQGWAILEHPHRRESLLYLFDAAAPPHLGMWLGPHTVTLEPFWEFAAVKAGGSLGFSLALSAGEMCGATAQGAWVACRAPEATGDTRVGVVARLHPSTQERTAVLTSGDQTREMPLQSVWLPGVGEIGVAVAKFDGTMNDPLDVVVGSIKARRTE